MAFTLLVNGVVHSAEVPSNATLLNVLRDNLGLTGTKYGCGEGQCGACTVLIEGSPVRSCRMQVSSAAGKRITTVEGLAHGETLHPVQQAFLEVEAFQCGYCTPGMILTSVALLENNRHPTEKLIVERMDGNICRCGTYQRIIEAVQRASTKMKEQHAAA